MQVFQSTLPMKGATQGGLDTGTIANVSIHAPNEGSDALEVTHDLRREVSIHAPNEGSDSTSHSFASPYSGFNPRSQ